ncbi:hypothetical protein [Nitrosomonas sp. Nm34]|uniref:hypothetical protein n=1 Tax=Nitrosomonas sp. Nm34 TaxID=1881055 RepID=UPI0008E585B2|nr:hypothetical protein [Nitrosomonas sp. Nm34]SFI94747.1 hypothetical protein SAMN05428978_106410 [Nitrosomonas sp. Nm34]
MKILNLIASMVVLTFSTSALAMDEDATHPHKDDIGVVPTPDPDPDNSTPYSHVHDSSDGSNGFPLDAPLSEPQYENKSFPKNPRLEEPKPYMPSKPRLEGGS